jgi:hypothetical protein
MKAVLWLVLVGLVVAAAVFTFRPAPAPNPRGPNGECLLTGDARIVESMGDVVIQPMGNEEWTDVVLGLRGQGTGATNAGQPTGTFTLKRDIVKGRTALPMETFQKPTGERWIRIVMRPTDLDVGATVRGERCRLSKSF